MKAWLVQEGGSYGAGNKVTSSRIFNSEFVAWVYIFKNNKTRTGKVYLVSSTEPVKRINKPPTLK